MKYTLFNSSSGEISTNVTREDERGEISSIPQDPRNKDWQEYQEWLAKGNTPIIINEE